MKQKLLLKTMLLLFALIAGSSRVWAGDPETIWSENFDGLAANAKPTSPTNNAYTGVTYTCTDGTGKSPGETKIQTSQIGAGGASGPEMMVGKKGSATTEVTTPVGGKFTVVIPLDNYEGTLTLTYCQNKQSLKVSSPTTGVSGGQTLKPSTAGQQTTTFTGITAAMTSITIEFESTTTNNVRLDDIVLTGTKASGKIATTVTINGSPSTEVYMGESVTSPTSATVKAGETTVGNTVTWSSSNTNAATINASTGVITLVGPGSTTIKATFAEDATYNSSEASYVLKVYGIFTTMAELQAGCAAYGNTAMKGKMTFNNVYVTAIKGNNAYISDGTNGALIYKSSHGFTAGDKLASTALEMTMLNYNGFTPEITSLTKTTDGLTVTSGNEITPTSLAVDAITAANFGTLVKITSVTYDATNKVFKDASSNEIVFYDNFSASPTLTDGAEYDVTGIILLKNSTTVEICPRDADDVVAKAVKTIPTSNWTVGGNVVTSIAVTKGGTVSATFETNSTGTKSFGSSDENVATVSNTGVISLAGAAGIATITATTEANNTYYSSSAPLTVIVGEPVEDGIFNFGNYQDYGSGVVPTSENVYVEEEKTWTAGDITLTTNGKIRWYIGTNGLDLKLYSKKVSEVETTKIKLSAPSGKKLTKFVITGSGFGSMTADKGTYNSGTWTGSEDDVTLTHSGSGTTGISTITVFYTGQELPVSMGNEGYMTYCNKNAALSFGDLEAYIVSEIGTSSVTLSPITEAPANTPVVLKGSKGSHNLTVLESASAVGTNKLNVSGGSITTTDSKTVYALAEKSGTVGFYKVQAGVNVPAGKCYLSVAVTSAPEYLGFGGDGNTTGVETLNVERGTLNDNSYYNLAGQRVAQPTKGLYIVNGKKYIVK